MGKRSSFASRLLGLAVLAGVGLGGWMPTRAIAAPPKGAVTLSWRTVEGTRGDLSSLNGRIVVVVFFAQGDEGIREWMAAARSCQAALEYKGVSFVGVYKGTDAQGLKNFISDNLVTFPVHFDEKKGAEPVLKAWKIEKTPAVFILDPERVVVAEDVKADALESTLQAQLKKTPPRLFDEKKMAEAVAHVEFADAMLKLDRPKGAARALAQVTEDLQQSEALSERFVRSSRDLEARAPALIDETEQMFEKKKTAEAVVLLEHLKKALKGSLLEAKIDDQYNSFLDDPEVKAAVAKERKTAEADDLLASIDDHEAAKDVIGASAEAAKLIKTYPGTLAAAEAKKRVTQWESDPKLKRQLRDAEYGERADALLKAAETYKNSQMKDKARDTYEKIVKDFAGSSAADKAAMALKTLK